MVESTRFGHAGGAAWSAERGWHNAEPCKPGEPLKPDKTYNATITRAGCKLAQKLSPAIPITGHSQRVCSLIHRHAITYSHIQERWCNDEMSEKATARLEAREKQIEDRIRQLVESLPETDAGPFTVTFEGDPRGNTVRIKGPGEWARKLADNWDQESIGADNP